MPPQQPTGFVPDGFVADTTPPPPQAPRGSDRTRVDTNTIGVDRDWFKDRIANWASTLPPKYQWIAGTLAAVPAEVGANLLEFLSSPETIATAGARPATAAMDALGARATAARETVAPVADLIITKKLGIDPEAVQLKAAKVRLENARAQTRVAALKNEIAAAQPPSGLVAAADRPNGAIQPVPLRQRYPNGLPIDNPSVVPAESPAAPAADPSFQASVDAAVERRLRQLVPERPAQSMGGNGVQPDDILAREPEAADLDPSRGAASARAAEAQVQQRTSGAPPASVSGGTPPPADRPPSPVQAAPPPPATAAHYPQKFLNEVAIQARRRGMTLTDADYATAKALTDQGKTPAEAVASMAPPPKPRLTSAEASEYMRLRASGKSDAEAKATIEAARTLQSQFGLTTPTAQETRFPKGMRGKPSGAAGVNEPIPQPAVEPSPAIVTEKPPAQASIEQLVQEREALEAQAKEVMARQPAKSIKAQFGPNGPRTPEDLAAYKQRVSAWQKEAKPIVAKLEAAKAAEAQARAAAEAAHVNTTMQQLTDAERSEVERLMRSGQSQSLALEEVEYQRLIAQGMSPVEAQRAIDGGRLARLNR